MTIVQQGLCNAHISLSGTFLFIGWEPVKVFPVTNVIFLIIVLLIIAIIIFIFIIVIIIFIILIIVLFLIFIIIVVIIFMTEKEPVLSLVSGDINMNHG